MVPQQIDLEWMIAFVNAHATQPTEASTTLGDQISAPTLPEWLSAFDEADVALLADRWFSVFDAAANPERLASTINELLTLAPPAIAASSDGQHVRKNSIADERRTPLDRVSVAGVLTVLDLIDQDGPPRIGVCDEDVCRDVYIDHSPRRNRSFCSIKCQTRTRVRRHRRGNSTD